jgi:uncharacterized protein YyaL (SSP411 family)
VSRGIIIVIVPILLLALGCASTSSPPPTPTTNPAPAAIAWQPYSPAVFTRAKAEHRLVLMDLEAVWCHWCHVMDHITYSDPGVIALINQKYIAVKVDQDSRPDISNRYEDYGWPATVVFNGDGGELVKRQGYIPPGPMARMLQAIVDDPTPGPSVRAETAIQYGQQSSLPAALRDELQKRFDSNYDEKEGGWGTIHKYLDWDAIELSMNRARTGDKVAEHRARQTLDGALKLIDPVWGGIYQYSTDDDWEHPHFEKIMQFQAAAIRAYALAYATWNDPAYLKAAQDVRRFLVNFLTSPDGGYLTSQDADLVEGEHSASYFALDDAGRRKLGVPRIDRHIYSRENGWAVEAMATLYDSTSNTDALADATLAAEWIIAHRAIEGGGFRHDEHDATGPYLGDTLAMGRAFLALYESTADRAWLDRAQAAADFMTKHFTSAGGAPGFVPAEVSPGSPLAPHQELDENVSAARFLNLLSRYTGKPDDKAGAESAMRYLATPQIAESRGPWVAGILLAGAELSSEPLHLTVVGSKSDSSAGDLFREARRCPVTYKRVEWWDPATGPLPNADVEYPRLKFAAAFVCTSNTCSAPIRNAKALADKLATAR